MIYIGIYLMFVLPISLYIYNKDKGKFKNIKILNMFMVFIFYYLYADSLRNGIGFLIYHGPNTVNELYVSVGVVPAFVNYYAFYAHIFFNAIILFVLIALAFRSKKAYDSLKYLLPVLLILDALAMNFIIYNELINISKNVTDLSLLLLIFTTVLMKWGVFYIIYSRRSVRKFFYEKPA